MSKRLCPPHIPAPEGEECCVGHFDESEGKSCFRCKHCNHWIRPHLANAACDECTEEDNLSKGLCPVGHPAVPSERGEGYWKCSDPECTYEWGHGVISFRYRGVG